jgi:hypothetical protein
MLERSWSAFLGARRGRGRGDAWSWMRVSSRAEIVRVPSPLVGEGQGGGSTIESRGSRRSDGFNHPVQVFQDVVIPESEHGITLGFEPSVPSLVTSYARLEIVSFAVEFDDQTRRVTDKISDVPPHRHLPAKSQSVHMVRLEITPQQRLGPRHCPTKILCTRSLTFFDNSMRHLVTPLPNPPPQGGREQAVQAAQALIITGRGKTR